MGIKSTFLGIAALACSGNFSLNAAGIEFLQGTWAEILAKAKTENKLVFVDFYTQWCGPCYNMAQHVFVEPEVGNFYNSHFICAKIDAENGEGIELARKYGVRSYPTYAFIDPATEENVHQSGSRQEPEDFIATGKAALNPSQRSFYLKAEYEKGNRNKQFLIDYILYHHIVYQRKAVNTAFDELIAGGYPLTDPEVWSVFESAISGMDNRYIQEVSDQYAQFCGLFGKERVDRKLEKETSYGDVALLDKMCDFEGKTFNRKLILISKDIYSSRYEQAAAAIDEMIADPATDQQKLIQRLKFMVKIPYGDYKRTTPFWFHKCVEYLRYIAYNQSDRDDVHIHQEYARALEQLIESMADKSQLPEALRTAPKTGKTEYSMRPDALKPKPKRKK